MNESHAAAALAAAALAVAAVPAEGATTAVPAAMVQWLQGCRGTCYLFSGLVPSPENSMPEGFWRLEEWSFW